MKTVFALFAVMVLMGCNQSKNDIKIEKEVETLLVCEGVSQSIIAGLGGKQQTTFTLVKVGDKVVKVKTRHYTYTLDKVDVSTANNKGPIYIQLIADGDKIILRNEVTEDKRSLDTVIFNTGAYSQDQTLGWSEGQCTIGKKAF
mgnify:CR=1 FL=1|jgi:uncharacterized lipoprotein NlpE involved in copper resistance